MAFLGQFWFFGRKEKMENQTLYFQSLEAASEFQKKALASTTAKDAGAFMAMSVDASEIAERLYRLFAGNSIALYVECCVRAGVDLQYSSYLDFCARNNLQTLSEFDFNSVANQIKPGSVSGKPRQTHT